MKKQTLLNSLLIFFAAATLLFGFWGWQSQAAVLQINTGDAIYRAINALILSDTYETSKNWNDDWRVELARWLGLITFILGASKAATILLATHFQEFKAKRRKKHTILIGDDPFAAAIANTITAKGHQVNWITDDNKFSVNKNHHLHIATGLWQLSLAKKYGLNNAGTVVIALQDDAMAIAIARQIRAAMPSEDQLNIFVTIQSPWIAQHIDELEGITGIKIFSRASASARLVHRKHPPFLVAKKHEQERIHNVIIGFNQHGEGMLIDLLLSCLTTYLKKPLVTIVDSNAKNLRTQLTLRYPELHKSIEIKFIEGSLQGGQSNLSETAIQAIGEKHAITAAYICYADDSLSLSSALALRTITMSHQLIAGPIFTRLSSNNSLPEISAGISHIEPGQIIAFGALEQLVAETGILNDDADGLAKLMHLAYNETSHNRHAPSISWRDLAEDKRDANRRSIAHIFAKLSSAGHDVEPWIKAIDKQPNISNLPYIADFAQSDAIKESLAKLEHERWMADRRINGWRYTKTERDDARKLHTDLVPYSALSEASKEYDRVMINQLITILADKNNNKIN